MRLGNSRTHLALLKSSGIKWKSKMKWPEFVDIVGQAEQESLFALGSERTARCFGREFAFDCAEDRLDMYALPIAFGRHRGCYGLSRCMPSLQSVRRPPGKSLL